MSLGEVGTWLSGGTPSTSNAAYWGGDIPWISGASLKSFRISESDRRLTSLGAVNGSRLVEKGTTLFIVRGMSLKSEFRIGVAERQVAFGQDVKALIPGDGIDPHFLAHAIQARTNEILTMVEDTSHGTGRLDTERLQAMEIGIPSLEEQCRIVAAHAAFERRIGALEGMLVKLRLTTQAILNRSFGVAHDVSLGSWINRIEAGRSPMAEDTPAGEGEWGVLKVSAVQSGWFASLENKVVRNPNHIDAAYEVALGDLLMTRANTEELVGLACVVDVPHPRLMLSDKTLRIVPDADVADAHFIALVLSTPAVRRQVRIAATGTSASMKNISQKAIRELHVPDVSLKNQRKTVSVISAARRREAQLEQQVAKLRTVQRAVIEDLLAGRAQTA
ncbi:restriction endonuclease subunit S [Streptomyces zaehneri]|uniref:restriction endonuclease subunit S n=1 Tax=Streptomyces zaehneri TaxID=3051180 RepID=UPI0028D8AB9C|nr:restriction endonuclease subunit S [Streptomyces sp. DSM 40713]